MKDRFLKLSRGYFVLWLVLWLIAGSKVYLIRKTTVADLYEVLVLGAVMLVISYAGAWAVWAFSGKKQRTGELSYLVILTVVFLGRTILLYREAIAGG